VEAAAPEETSPTPTADTVLGQAYDRTYVRSYGETRPTVAPTVWPMNLEETLAGWREPSSDTEHEQQERTERMVREAVEDHAAFKGVSLSVYAKGSYANNTNVRADSDVDIAVQCHEVEYWEKEEPGGDPPVPPYEGIWTPTKLRSELGAALRAKFPSQVDDSGSTALTVHSSTARVDADVVPCFDYRYHFASGGSREGTRGFKKSGASFENYPAQQLANGNAKNKRTDGFYKQAVRIMKRTENAMVDGGHHREVPSYFIECLLYNCPDNIFLRTTWTQTIEGILVNIWDGLQGDEPTEDSERWVEVNNCKYLFYSEQKWSRADGRDFAKAAWSYLGYAS
jgi:predicted nucleotidyltransferase